MRLTSDCGGLVGHEVLRHLVTEMIRRHRTPRQHVQRFFTLFDSAVRQSSAPEKSASLKSWRLRVEEESVLVQRTPLRRAACRCGLNGGAEAPKAESPKNPPGRGWKSRAEKFSRARILLTWLIIPVIDVPAPPFYQPPSGESVRERDDIVLACSRRSRPACAAPSPRARNFR